jgi:hypothetical protein
VTVWVAEVPGQLLKEEVTLKVTVCGLIVVFHNWISGIGDPVPGVIGQGMMLPAGQFAVQLKSVPWTVDESWTVSILSPEQMGCEAEQEMSGFGFTCQINGCVGPTQLLA